MKKIILPIAFLLAGVFGAMAQNNASQPPPPGGGSLTCDSLTVDSIVFIGTPPHLEVYIHNQTETNVAYPSMSVILTPNPYIYMSSTPAVSSYLHNASGANGGITSFYLGVDSAKAQDSIPANTVFTGSVHLADPTDSVIYCDYNISFTYGAVVSGINDLNAQASIYVTVTGNELNVRGDIQNTSLQVLNLSGQVVLTDNNTRTGNTRSMDISSLPAGMYFIAMQRNHEMVVRKFLKY